MNLDIKQKKKPMWKPTATKEIFSYKEIFGFVLVVLIVSFIIFPKGKIEKLVFEEDTNIELSNIYLENLIRITNNDQLRLLLAERYIKLGYKYKAIPILNFLEKSPNKEINSKAKVLRYQILKSEYFAKDTPDDKKELLKIQMKKLLIDSLNSTQNLETIQKIYKEALSMAFIDVAYQSVKKAVVLSKNSKYWLTEAYKQALAISNFKDAQRYATELYRIDKENKVKWLNELYNISVSIKDYTLAIKALEILSIEDRKNSALYNQKIIDILLYTKDYKSALALLKNLYQRDITNRYIWLEKMANIYLMGKNYKEAFNLYNQAFLNEKNPQKRKELFKKAVEILSWSKDFDNLKIFLNSYYQDFLNDKEMAKFILKTALATGDSKFAYKIALEIKERGL
ncbi:hypothetical protein [Sulfurihydrogenibium sp.]|uniref:tetratricopeptide repeat protein n=1 Tax=Sulfurihydrogenibium sp. TaxID=2053621 RepID=UPI00261682B9|nr:hypothetical protein [Sulfurihydrogenibium sp.]